MPCWWAWWMARASASTSAAAPGPFLSLSGPLPTRDRLRQGAAVHQLHREVRQSVVLADLVDLDDVRVRQPCHRLGLGAEAIANAGRGVLARQHHLERDEPVEPSLPGLVDHGHPTATQFVHDRVTR